MTQQIPLQIMTSSVEQYIFRMTGAKIKIKLNMDKEQEELDLLFRAFQIATQQF